MKLWKATLSYNPCVEEVEVLRATDKSVWISVESWVGLRDQRRGRFTDYESYFDTEAQAISHCLEHLRSDLALARSVADQCEEALNKFCSEHGIEQ